MDPLTMALAGGGLSLLSGLGARQAAKKQNKAQAAADLIANQQNAANTAARNKRNLDLGKSLLKVPEVTKTVTDTVHEEAEAESGWEKSNSGETTVIDSAQDNYSFVDTKAMMQAAEDSGFNPVTWLNAGGMQAYTQTGSRGRTVSQTDTWAESSYGRERSAWSKDSGVVTETKKGHNAAAAYALMSPESALVQSSQVAKVPSILETIGDAGQAGLKSYIAESTRLQGQDFQSKLLDRQLAAIADANKRNGGTSTVNQGTPSYTTSGGTTTTGGKASGTGALSDPNTTGMDPQKVATINPFQQWIPGFKTNPKSPSGQAIEDYLGEGPFSWLFAPIKMADDVVYTMTGKGIPEHFKANPSKPAVAKSWAEKLREEFKDSAFNPDNQGVWQDPPSFPNSSGGLR